MDLIAREVGCQPSNWWLVFKPLLALKVMYGPMTVMHYRLRGPGAKPEIAKSVIKNLPIGTRITDLMFYTAIHWTLALFKWPLVFIFPGSYDLINTAKYSIPRKHVNAKKEVCCA